MSIFNFLTGNDMQARVRGDSGPCAWCRFSLCVLVIILLAMGDGKFANAATVGYGSYVCQPVKTKKHRITSATTWDDALIDGDTVRLLCEVWRDGFVRVSLRLHKVNTPETRTKCLPEKALGLKATAFALEWFGDAEYVYAHIYKGNNKFAGRILGDVTHIDGPPQGWRDAMIQSGHGVAYHGEARTTLCEKPKTPPNNEPTASDYGND